MKLKDTLPHAPFLVEVTDASGQRHGNFAKVDVEIIGGEQTFFAHYSEFLPKNQEQLKKRLRKFTDIIAITEVDGSPVSDAKKQSIVDMLYDYLLNHLRENKDVVITRDRDSGGIQSIQAKPVLDNIESAYRSALPRMAKNCGILFDTETNHMPQIIITDHHDISSLVPQSWLEKTSFGYAYKTAGSKPEPECDTIFFTHRIKGLYELFSQHKGKQAGRSALPGKPGNSAHNIPEPFILVSSTLGHELCHHLGLDTIIAGHGNDVHPKLREDIEHCKQIALKAKTVALDMEENANFSTVLSALEREGFIDKNQYLPLLDAALKDIPLEQGARIGRDISLTQLKNRSGELKGADRRYLKRLIQAIITQAEFAASNAAIDTVSAMLQQTGQNVSDEILPTILMVQSTLGVESTRLLFPNAYPAIDMILKKHGIDMTKSVEISQIERPGH